MQKMILGVFQSSRDAEDAIGWLKDHEYNPKDISIIMKDKAKAEDLSHSTGADVAGGALSGATTGGIVGALAGLLASTVIPGLGAFFIGGPIAAALGLGGAAASTVSGAVTGAAAGGLLGALTGFGLSEDEAKDYEGRVNAGGILVMVPARSGEEEEIREIMHEFNADQIRMIEHTESTRHSMRDHDHSAHTSSYASDIRRSSRDDDEL